MSIKKRLFGKTPQGEEVFEFVLANDNAEVSLISRGAALRRLLVADKDGEKRDVLLGFDDLEGYIERSDYQGVAVGPFANRIEGGSLKIGGKEIIVPPNEKGRNLLHSGGLYSNAVWSGEVPRDNKVVFKKRFKDMEGGFPGNTDAEISYTLESDGTVLMEYKAVSDSDMYFNLTNHAYFNLAGYDGGDILSHKLKINADSFLPVDENSIPTGESRKVEGTPFDFREFKEIGRDIEADYDQLKLTGGYDHCFCLNDFGKGCRLAASVKCEKSGLCLDVFTDLPGVQLYTGNFLSGTVGKGGKPMNHRSGFCLETQYYPDSPNKPQFPSCYVKAGEVFFTKTSYRVYRY